MVRYASIQSLSHSLSDHSAQAPRSPRVSGGAPKSVDGCSEGLRRLFIKIERLSYGHTDQIF